MSYKVIVKPVGKNSPSCPGRVSIIGPDGEPMPLVQEINFSAKVGEFPKLEILSIVDDFELEVSEEIVSLEWTDKVEIKPSGFLDELKSKGGFMSEEELLLKLGIEKIEI